MRKFSKKPLKKLLLRFLYTIYRRTIVQSPDQDFEAKLESWGCAVGSSDHLEIVGCDAVDLAARFGTPLHVVHQQFLEKNYNFLLSTVQRRYPKSLIAYSYKTNPLPGVLDVLHRQGAWAEVISHYELWLALKLKVPPGQIIYNGPGKSSESLELAVRENVGLINIDHLQEGMFINDLAGRHGRPQKIGIRLVTSVGWSSQFGFPIADGVAEGVFRELAALPNLDVRAMHVHLGTGISDPDRYRRAVEDILELFAGLRRDGNELEFLDVGGGFGVNTVTSYRGWAYYLRANGFPLGVPKSSIPTFDAFVAAIVDPLRDYLSSTGAPEPILVLEPGRRVTSSAQCLLLEVHAIKPGENGVINLILSGGTNVGQPLQNNHHVVLPASKMKASPEQTYNLFGPLCHPGDLLVRGVRLPQMKVGDVVAIMDSGAYFIPNETMFSFPKPAVVMVDGDGKAILSRGRQTFQQMIENDLGHWHPE